MGFISSQRDLNFFLPKNDGESAAEDFVGQNQLVK